MFQALYQELNECHSEISSLIQNLNGLNQNVSSESTNDIKNKLADLKIRNNEYLKLVHEQTQTISNIISDKYVKQLNNYLWTFNFKFTM